MEQAGHRWSCFAAGTPLLTPTGCKYIEDFRIGDLLLSRSEFDHDGPVVAKAVEEVFVNHTAILHLHVAGKVIQTTGEHPFYVDGRGWIPASSLLSGDLLLSHDGQQSAVEEVFDTGEWKNVYNLRVADFHTYFVGSSEWGFSVWAHNTYHLNNNGATSTFGVYEIWVNGPSKFLFKIGKANMGVGAITQSSGLPTCLHQQVRALEKVYGKGNVIGKVVEELGVVTTLQAKAAESARLQRWFDAMQFVPRGNKSSFIPTL